MKILKRNQRICLLVAIGVALMAFGPAIVMAGGEPGTGCGEGYKYDPAPYIGDLTITWVAHKPPDGLGDVYATGTLYQAGNSTCTGEFSGSIIDDRPLDEFQNWKSKDLRLTCLENLCALDDQGNILLCPFSCHDDGELFEVVGVGGMQWLPKGESFTAKFVIMNLE